MCLFNNGSPCIADFGLAALAESELSITAQGDLLGTPAYMAPEQAAGSSEITNASDIYALGVVLYQLLCGQLPFSGDSIRRTSSKTIRGTAASPQTLAQHPAGSANHLFEGHVARASAAVRISTRNGCGSEAIFESRTHRGSTGWTDGQAETLVLAATGAGRHVVCFPCDSVPDFDRQL